MTGRVWGPALLSPKKFKFFDVGFEATLKLVQRYVLVLVPRFLGG